jgi:hypothetical protein
MTDRPSPETLGARLLAEDRLRHAGLGAPAGDAYALVGTLLEREVEVERQVRTIAFWAWVALIALLPLTGFVRYLKYTDVELVAELAHHFSYVMLALCAVALLLALLMTTAWLLRQRALSLAVVERRLASIEARLSRGS